MSLGVAIKGPEGVVLAADSRVTLEARQGDKAAIIVNFDSATKLLTFSKPNNYVGVVTYGVAVIGLRTAQSFVPEFEVSLLKKEETKKRLSVKRFADELSSFFMERWKESIPGDYSGPSMMFLIGGYDEQEPYGEVYVVDIPKKPEPEPRNAGKEFGMTWGGQHQIVGRLIQGFDPALLEILKRHLNLNEEQIGTLLSLFKESIEFQVPYQVLPLQDCVDLAIFLIRTTITGQQLSVGIRGVGGMIEVATITRTGGLQLVQKKKIHGEYLPELGGRE